MTRVARELTPDTLAQLCARGIPGEQRAVVEPGRGAVSYTELDRLADEIAARLCGLGLKPGARVGVCLGRSTDAIAVMLGSLRAGCVYVPVDAGAPAERNAEIHADCAVQATILEAPLAEAYRGSMAGLGAKTDVHAIAAVGLGEAVRTWAANGAKAVPDSNAAARQELACLLYTSGTTGRHKGWMMSRAGIAVLVQWGHALFGTNASDVFANHAPFNFGMSLFDIYSAFNAGATLLLVPDELRAYANRVVDVLSRERATFFFATPSILSRIAALDDLEARDLSALRAILFGGEVFPAPPLQQLRQRLPHPRYFNAWGSTETNIGTYYELSPGEELDAPPPMGRPCEHYEARIVGRDGEIVAPGAVGELQLRGPGLNTGYLNQAELNAERLLPVPGGLPWYRSADLVVEDPPGVLRYAGRIGRMVKLRGYRVEPGEIETRLYQHPKIREASVVAVDGPNGTQLVAHLSGERLSLVELKQFCAVKLPPYMIPERFVYHEALPRNPRGKVDFEALRARSSV